MKRHTRDTNIVKHTSGDRLELHSLLHVPGSGVPLPPHGYAVEFALSETRFDFKPIARLGIGDGMSFDGHRAGLVHISVPRSVSDRLRRGSYAYSIQVSSEDGLSRETEETGTIQVEYEPTSPEHDIPYRDDQDD